MLIMRRVGLVVVVFCLATLAAIAATPGTFRGVVVEAPEALRAEGWIFVKGKNGMMRKVEIKGASIRYGESYPASKRKASAKSSLKAGIEVRVTATQGKDGEWHASQVEIIDSAAEEIPPDPDPNHRVT